MPMNECNCLMRVNSKWVGAYLCRSIHDCMCLPKRSKLHQQPWLGQQPEPQDLGCTMPGTTNTNKRQHKVHLFSIREV